jgi:hypothetical protein
MWIEGTDSQAPHLFVKPCAEKFLLSPLPSCPVKKENEDRRNELQMGL